MNKQEEGRITARLVILRMIANIYDNYTVLTGLDDKLPDKILRLLYQLKAKSY